MTKSARGQENYKQLERQEEDPDDMDDDYQPKGMLTKKELDKQKRFFVNEDDWQSCTKWIIFPPHPLKKMWDFFIFGCVLYSCVTVPYRLAFEEAQGLTFAMEMGIQVIFLVDVGLNFNTAYLGGRERFVIHRPKIARTYLKG